MKNSNKCYLNIYLSHKKTKQKPFNLNLYQSKDESLTTNKKRINFYVPFNTQTYTKKEPSIPKALNEVVFKSDLSITSQNSSLISSYEKSIISLFANLKEIIEEKQYKEIKSKFFKELEDNLLNDSKENSNNKTSTLSSSNSILSMLQESKIKCYLQKKNNDKKKGKNIVHQHKSLYSLSKPGKKVSSNSPGKNLNDKMMTTNYYSFNKFRINYPKEKLKKEQKEVKKRNTRAFSNVSVGNYVKNFNYQGNNATGNDISIRKGNNSTTDKMQDNNSSSDLLSKIKSSLDDKLKGFFDFSYENFLNRESEREQTRRSGE